MDHLLQAAVRSVLLAAVAALGLWRVKSASIRHAVWTLVTASMLAQIVLVQSKLSPPLPVLPLRVQRAVEPVAIPVATIDTRRPIVFAASKPTLSWEQIAAVVYFCGLIFFAVRFAAALAFARGLVRESEPAGRGIHQSHRVLPRSWSEWDAAKLQAVVAHDQAHVRRRDWAISAMASLNRCVFWFHPLAWRLERQLARLAEQACDDAALSRAVHKGFLNCGRKGTAYANLRNLVLSLRRTAALS